MLDKRAQKKGGGIVKRIVAMVLVVGTMLLLASCGAPPKKQNTVSESKPVQQETKSTVSETEKQSTVTQTTPESTEQSTVTQTAPVVLPEIQPIALGQTVTTKNCTFTLNRVSLSYDVKPDNPPSYYQHYPASSGQVYIYLNATIKNTQKQSLECDEIYSVEADYNNGYTYTGFNIVTDYDGDFSYANINSVEPLQSMGVHCLVDCPEEVETSSNPLSLTISFRDGTKYSYKIR